MSGIIIFTTIAFILGLMLALTNHYLNKEDKRVEQVTALLPGYNCGACGSTGCKDMANNIVYNKADPKRCKPMKEEQYQNLMAYLKSKKIKGA